MEKREIKTYIESITKVNDEFWEKLFQISKTIILDKGAKYIKEGEHIKSLGFLESGLIRIYHLDENGNEWNKAFLEANSFLLGNVNYEEKTEVYFEALTNCEILKVPISFFEESLNLYPELTKVYQQQIGDLFKRKSEREISFLQLTAKERYLKFKKNNAHLLKIIPQYHIASYLGITPTQLSRIKLSSENTEL